tara:strand:- start:1883 stop:2044 length:162 start_codon:yes stop_codon:yes gene_type:complete
MKKNRNHWYKSTLFELRTEEIFANYSVSLQSRAKFIYQPPVEFYDKPASSKNH